MNQNLHYHLPHKVIKKKSLCSAKFKKNSAYGVLKMITSVRVLLSVTQGECRSIPILLL